MRDAMIPRLLARHSSLRNFSESAKPVAEFNVPPRLRYCLSAEKQQRGGHHQDNANQRETVGVAHDRRRRVNSLPDGNDAASATRKGIPERC
jgi:hypothetical protein